MSLVVRAPSLRGNSKSEYQCKATPMFPTAVKRHVVSQCQSGHAPRLGTTGTVQCHERPPHAAENKLGVGASGKRDERANFSVGWQKIVHEHLLLMAWIWRVREGEWQGGVGPMHVHACTPPKPPKQPRASAQCERRAWSPCFFSLFFTCV